METGLGLTGLGLALLFTALILSDLFDYLRTFAPRRARARRLRRRG